MASNPLPATPDAAPPGLKRFYEVYVEAGDGFDLQEVNDDREAALTIARRLAARPGSLVRVMCETYDPERDETIERIIFDSTAAAAATRSGEPGRSLPDARGSQPARPAVPREPLPKLVVVFGGLSIAMALAAAGMAVF